jgi:aminotransferase
VRDLAPSGLREFFDIINTRRDIISLGLGEPDFATPQRIYGRAIRSLEEGQTGYTSNQGIQALRQAVSSQLKRRWDLQYVPDEQALITVGVSEALHAAMMALIDPGDEVIVVQPCFVSYAPLVSFAGGVPVVVATSADRGFRVTAEEISAAITPRTVAILMGYPNNPTGAVMREEDLVEIAQLASEADLTVISDEIYERLVYDSQHICFASLPEMAERTVVLQGFSKTYAMTGWRVGYAAGPRHIIEAMSKVHEHVVMSAPTAGQVAAVAALEDGDEEAERMRRSYDRRRQIAMRELQTIGLPFSEPGGAFYVFPGVASTGLTSEEFAWGLLEEEKVAVVPGNAFGECGEGHVRMAYVASDDDLREAMERIGRFVRRHRVMEERT